MGAAPAATTDLLIADADVAVFPFPTLYAPSRAAAVQAMVADAARRRALRRPARPWRWAKRGYRPDLPQRGVPLPARRRRRGRQLVRRWAAALGRTGRADRNQKWLNWALATGSEPALRHAANASRAPPPRAWAGAPTACRLDPAEFANGGRLLTAFAWVEPRVSAWQAANC